MRWWLMGLAAMAVAGLAACDRDRAEDSEDEEVLLLPKADASALPPRKTGLWKQTFSSGQGKQTTRFCTNELVEEKVSWAGVLLGYGTACTNNTAEQGPDGAWRFRSVCDLGRGVTATFEGTRKGDPASRLEVAAQTSFTGAAAPGAGKTQQANVVMEYQGPCPSDWLPGDLEYEGGHRQNVAGADMIEELMKSTSAE